MHSLHCRSVLTAPLHWVGLGSSSHTERVLLFRDYKEQEKLPFLVFQVAIKVCRSLRDLLSLSSSSSFFVIR